MKSVSTIPPCAALARLRATTGDLQPVFRDLGEALLNSTRERFRRQTAPDGSPWTALSPAYRARKKQNKDKILTLRGILHGTLAYQVTPDALLVRTPLIYGAPHQFGDPRRNLPARLFLGLSIADRAEIDTILRKHLARALAQAAALATVLKSGIGDLATKEDLTRLESKLESRLNLLEERTEGRFKLLQWMLAFNLAISVALLWILIRTATAG
ncbi:MAG TPA: phage virion morphogenesis protein [Candidatus Competibacteraceae bacterium]|nr:phage virion morphogenesis protein [Candidatus Competibacteraceae bacterium]HRZ05461.1 phage virion morphogenesis protein [Candidatus Competibacteraceae bacterium]HSA45951.1 phage virion morphogenesis protein [Candidatus Competibacteraceae bacterium]